MKNEAEFTVNIPVPDEDSLRGKFKIKVKLSYRDILNMDAMRRQLLGTGGNEASDMASLIATALAKIRTHALETPSWWKSANDGLDFEDLNVVLDIYGEITKIEKEHLSEVKKEAEKATEELKPVVAAKGK